MDTPDRQAHSAKRNPTRSLAVLGLIAGAIYAAPVLFELGSAQASGGGKGGGSGVIAVASDPVAVKECGACHMAFPPNTLPDGSWRAIMGNLSNHFGDDASLSPEVATQITDYYVQHAGGRGTGPLRITESRWFTHEHGNRRFRTKVTSMARCTECHTTQTQSSSRF